MEKSFVSHETARKLGENKVLKLNANKTRVLKQVDASLVNFELPSMAMLLEVFQVMRKRERFNDLEGKLDAIREHGFQNKVQKDFLKPHQLWTIALEGFLVYMKYLLKAYYRYAKQLRDPTTLDSALCKMFSGTVMDPVHLSKNLTAHALFAQPKGEVTAPNFWKYLSFMLYIGDLREVISVWRDKHSDHSEKKATECLLRV